MATILLRVFSRPFLPLWVQLSEALLHYAREREREQRGQHPLVRPGSRTGALHERPGGLRGREQHPGLDPQPVFGRERGSRGVRPEEHSGALPHQPDPQPVFGRQASRERVSSILGVWSTFI